MTVASTPLVYCRRCGTLVMVDPKLTIEPDLCPQCGAEIEPLDLPDMSDLYEDVPQGPRGTHRLIITQTAGNLIAQNSDRFVTAHRIEGEL